MTSIRRSDDSSLAAIPTEPDAPAPQTAKPALRAVPLPVTNQVESHKPAQLGGRPIDGELVNASADLVKGYVHPGIFEEARPERAQKELSKLPPREFSAVLAKLEQSGTLDRFVSQLTPEQRTAFLDTAVRKNALQRNAGQAASGPLDPPATPVTYAIPAGAPLGLAKAASQSNFEAGSHFYASQDRYFDRYEAAAKKCTSGAELRGLGPHAPLRHVDSGLSASHPNYNQLFGEWVGGHRAPSDARLQKAVSDKLSDFICEGHAGSFFVEGKIEVVALDEKVSMEASGRVSDSGKTDGKAAAKAKLPGGVMVGRDSKGNATLGVHAGGYSAAIKGEKAVTAAKMGVANVEVEMDLEGNLSKLKAQVAGSGITLEKNGRARVDVALEVGGGYAFYDPSKAEFGGGGKVKFKTDDGNAISLEAGFGMQGLSAANARHGLNGVGVWSTPPELSAGKAWADLGAAKQDTYRRLGWTEQEWSSKSRR